MDSLPQEGLPLGKRTFASQQRTINGGKCAIHLPQVQRDQRHSCVAPTRPTGHYDIRATDQNQLVRLD